MNKPIPESPGPPPASRVERWCTTFVVVVFLLLICNLCYRSTSEGRVARLVGINWPFPVSDSALNEAAEAEFPVGMTDQEAIEKLTRRGLDETRENSVIRRPSEDEDGTEYFTVLLRDRNYFLSLTRKDYMLVLTFDAESHRIKKSEVTYALTGL